ncbi:hypothetical protein DERF_014797 [Dermatophagoides farinae]|uniref:DFP2 n=1 Tax=Dermatophagoides farinae TaxID=6954 RepID=A0A922KXG5_DERFA|nr:hypothetical protein DERF_014797 [Dermatophagoides farinae]
MDRLLSIIVIAILLPATISFAYSVPPPLTDGNDVETNRVLEQFIWKKIISAPTDPKKAYQELRSSLDAISQRNDDHIQLPESLYMLRKSVMQPRSLRRRSSYPSPASNESAIPSTSETSPGQQKIFNHYTNLATTNKYIPEFGAKELYQLDNNNNNHKQTDISIAGQSQPSLNNRRVIDYIQEQLSEYQEILRKHPSKKRAYKAIQQQDANDILSIHKYNRKSLNKQRPATSNRLEEEIKPEQETQQQVTHSPPVKSKNRGHQQAQSQSIYDILPMPSYGQLKNTIRPYGGFGSDNYGNNMMGSTGNIPPSPATQLSSPFEAKRTFQMAPLMEYKGSEMEQYPEQQQYEPTSQTLEPQIIDVVPDEQPIQIVFRSSSAKVQVKQVHTPIPYNDVETTRTEEKPQLVLHKLVRPIVQEVIEIIQPYRRVTQEIRPVLEEIRTVVAKQADTQRIQKDRLGKGSKKW